MAGWGPSRGGDCRGVGSVAGWVGRAERGRSPGTPVASAEIRGAAGHEGGARGATRGPATGLSRGKCWSGWVAAPVGRAGRGRRGYGCGSVRDDGPADRVPPPSPAPGPRPPIRPRQWCCPGRSPTSQPQPVDRRSRTACPRPSAPPPRPAPPPAPASPPAPPAPPVSAAPVACSPSSRGSGCGAGRPRPPRRTPSATSRSTSTRASPCAPTAWTPSASPTPPRSPPSRRRPPSTRTATARRTPGNGRPGPRTAAPTPRAPWTCRRRTGSPGA
ncbi:hypothetical protein GA0115246_100755 [Streptomyces sp. SolWspMP-sol7th]|nr:hypothetical protein GA0115246_100755 [Streptomyces sp. SolWspMP-sol7th]